MGRQGWAYFTIALLAHFCAGQAFAGYAYLDSHGDKSEHLFPFAGDKLNKSPKVDLSCFISAPEAHKRWRSGWLLVDIRKTKVFNQFHVLNSINIPLHTVASRAFLKDKRVLLIGDGFHMDEVSSACKDLKKKGFQTVLAVFGGTLAWGQFSFPFEGAAPQGLNLAMLPVERFNQMKNENFWSLINLKPEHQVEWERLLPTLNLARQKLNNTQVDRAVESKYKAILFIDDNGSYQENELKKLKLQQSYPVFVLEGGMKAYKKYLKRQQLMNMYALKPKQKFKTCGY